MCAQFFEASPQVPLTLAKVKSLMIDAQPTFDEEHAPKVELEHFSPSLRYEFLSPNSTYPTIINASLSASQIDSLLRILILHHKAKGYDFDDKRDSPFCVYELHFDGRCS